MYDDLVKRLREFASIPEHCENVSDCDKCTKEEICLSFTNKRIIEVATQAADAIDDLITALTASNEVIAKNKRKRGEWIKSDDGFDESWVCSECMEEYDSVDADFIDYAHYCPNCGARMVTDDV